MATGPKIVHKQFNSPMGLYSRQNIQETLNKHIQNLDNGSVGIDFNNPNTDKPGNLANSAVLRMLEEEERSRKGYPKLDPTQIAAILAIRVRANHRYDKDWPPKNSRVKLARSWDGQINTTGCYVYPELLKTTQGQKKVVWPPVPETNGYHQSQSPAFAQHSPQNYQLNQPQYQPQSNENQYQQQHNQYQQQHNQYQQQQNQYQQQQNQYQQQQNQYQNQQNQYQSQQNQAQYPQQQPGQQRSGFCEGKKQEATGLSKLIPFGPGVQASQPAPYRQSPLSPPVQQYRQPSRWAPAPAAPTSPQTYSQPAYEQPQQSFSPQPQYQSQFSPQPQYQSEPVYEPPPTTITLRPHQPVHQRPPPVFASQPATASFNGGVNMRGDQKWPPQSVREAVEAENEARRQLAKGPACRPRKVKKDYTGFFAQHALNHNLTGYRAPPGTQHYEDQSGRSSY